MAGMPHRRIVLNVVLAVDIDTKRAGLAYKWSHGKDLPGPGMLTCKLEEEAHAQLNWRVRTLLDELIDKAERRIR